MKDISIVIPYYNHVDTLPKLLDAISQQSITNIESIIVDDCSDVPCDAIVRAYQKNGLCVSLIRNTKREQTKNTRLRGISSAQGRLVTCIDADDTLYGTKALCYHIEKQRETNADITHFSAHISRAGKALPPHDVRWGQPLLEGFYEGDIYSQFTQSGFAGHTIWGKIIKKTLWDAVLPHALTSSVRRYAEDFFLSALLYFHARSYYGSSRIGYVYDWQDKTNHKAFGRAATYHSMLEEFIPYICRNGVAPAALEKTRAHLLDRVRFYVSLFLSNSMGGQATAPLPPEFYGAMLEHGDAEKVLRVLMDGLH